MSESEVVVPVAQKECWSVDEVAAMTGLGSRTIWRIAREPKSGFPAPFRVGRRTLWHASKVRAWLEAREVQG